VKEFSDALLNIRNTCQRFLYPWDKEKLSSAKYIISLFMKRNGDISLKKPRGLSRVVLQQLSKKVVES
jgi:hypothetical protein